MTQTIRHPDLTDAAAITQLVRSSGSLDANSHYAHLLLCHHFRDTCLLAEDGSQILGFVSAYRPPNAPDVVFVWQIAVSAAAQGAGIAGRLLAELIQRTTKLGVRYLEATVTPSNTASQRLFEGCARRCGAPLAKQGLFSAELFGGIEQHEPEDLYRIGPFT